MAASQHYLQSNVFKRNESKLQQAIQFKAEVLLNVVITLWGHFQKIAQSKGVTVKQYANPGQNIIPCSYRQS